MSYLNKRVRKVQKGGSILDMATGPVKNAADLFPNGAIEEVTAPVAKVADSVTDAVGDVKDVTKISKFQESLGKLTDIDDQTEEKLNELRSTKFADPQIWDLLYEEPCYIDPGSGHLVISKIRQLWCNFQSDEVKRLLGLIGEEKTVKIADINKCKNEFFKAKMGKSSDEINQDWKANEEFNALIEDIRKPGIEGGKEPGDQPPMGEDDYNKAMDELKKHCPDSIEEAELSNALDMSNLMFNPPDTSDPQKKNQGGCPDMEKFVFCLIFKFLLGPGGFFVIKMLPHVIKFYYTVKNSFFRIFNGLNNSLKSFPLFSGIGPKRPYVYYGKKGVDQNKKPIYGYITNWYPNWLDTLIAYFGTVIPFHYLKYDWGQKYGKGEFGKLIVGLVVVSAVIIIIGGVGITMLFLCFAFYCLKTLSMFSDNIKEKGKGKA